MQTANTTASKPSEVNPRGKILNTYLTTIENSFQDNRPQIKLINFGTGSGKTHQLFQAVCETISRYPEYLIVCLYVAPLREHLRVPDSIKLQNENIPFFTLYSQEWKVADEFLKLYKQWIKSINRNKNFWGILQNATSREILDESRQCLSNISKAIDRYQFIQKTDFGNKDFSSQELLQAQRDINNFMEKFLEIIIKNIPDEKSWPVECLELVKIFYPLYLLRDRSGFLMLTYDKFETSIPYFDLTSGQKWVKKSSYLDEYITKNSNDSRKFIIAFDEQEDGYQIMLKNKIDIISPDDLAINNALSSINREFSILFSKRNQENQDFLRFVRRNPGVFYEFEEYKKGKEIEPKLAIYAETYRRLTEEGNSIDFLQQLAAMNDSIEASLREIAGVYGDFGDEDQIALTHEMLSKVFSVFENNRSLLIPQKLYSKLSNDLMNIFAYNNLYIYNIKPLKALYLSRYSGGHVQITEQKTRENVSVAELIYAILAIRLQIQTIRDFLKNVLDAKDSQSQSLDIWSRQMNRIQKASEESILRNRPIKYLNREYVYESLKSIINIMEITRYQHPKNNLINHRFREVSIGSTVILTSPEHKIISMLKNNSNVIFLISATGGIFGDLSTSYDLRYLEDQLRDESGQSTFKTMNGFELNLCEEIRRYRLSNRQIEVKFFEESLLTFPNQKTLNIVERFESMALTSFIELHDNNDKRWMGVHKVQELRNFIRFLFYLFEDDSIQETIAFTQSLYWIKELIKFAELKQYSDFKFERSPEHPNIYYVQLTHKSYRSPIRVKLILYEASFNTLYNTSSPQKSYLDELVEETDQKIFFISAYQSASKGLNPIVKTRDGKEKDFDSLVLLMDKYFTEMGPTFKKSKESGRTVTIAHFALMKNIVRLSDSNIEIKDFNSYLSQPEAADFKELQHQILLGKGILQSIGRTERRDYHDQIVKIFINSETRKNLVNFFRYLDREEPSEIRKLSVNNYEVFLRVQEEEAKRSIQDYDDHVYNEIEAAIAFKQFRKQMLAEIDLFHEDGGADAILQKWELLRDPLAFQNPSEYLEKLRSSGLFPIDFIDSLFYYKPEQPAFVPYLCEEREFKRSYQIISDSVHGQKIYPYLKRLYPDYLKINSYKSDLHGDEIDFISPSTAAIQRLYRKLLPHPGVFETYIPRPNFFNDVFYPSFTENFAKDWIQEIIFEGLDWKTIESRYRFEPLADLRKYNKLYELFDLFYVKDEKLLLCIDVKAWSKISGNRLSKRTLEKAQNKLEAIRSEYPEFQIVKGMLLNLHAPQEKNVQHSPTLYSGNLIYFDSNHLPVESDGLRRFLFTRKG